MPLFSRASTTSVVHSRVLVVSLLVSGPNFLTVTSYVHFAPFASGSGSALIICSSVIGCFFPPLLQAHSDSAKRTLRREVWVTRTSYSCPKATQLLWRSGAHSCVWSA